MSRRILKTLQYCMQTIFIHMIILQFSFNVIMFLYKKIKTFSLRYF